MAVGNMNKGFERKGWNDVLIPVEYDNKTKERNEELYRTPLVHDSLLGIISNEYSSISSF